MASPVLKPEEATTYVIARFHLGEIKFENLLGEVDRVTVGFYPLAVMDIKCAVVGNILMLDGMDLATLLKMYSCWYPKPQDELKQVVLKCLTDEISGRRMAVRWHE